MVQLVLGQPQLGAGHHVVAVVVDGVLVGLLGPFQVLGAGLGDAEHVPDVGVVRGGLTDQGEVLHGLLVVVRLQGIGALTIFLGRIERRRRSAWHGRLATAARPAT